VPEESHVSTPPPLPLPPSPTQRVEPGVHDPEHEPLTHAWLTHALGVPHAPAEEHFSTLLPVHCCAPGLQATHAPERHTGSLPEQATGLPYCPFELQVSTPLPPPTTPASARAAHCVVPGEQTPVHAPPLHT
jgi:hypothetical protein